MTDGFRPNERQYDVIILLTLEFVYGGYLKWRKNKVKKPSQVMPLFEDDLRSIILLINILTTISASSSNRQGNGFRKNQIFRTFYQFFIQVELGRVLVLHKKLVNFRILSYLGCKSALKK